MRTKELVVNILINKPETRNSDKLLTWEVYKALGLVTDVVHVGTGEAILKETFLSVKIPPPDSISRYRRLAQELRADLLPTNEKIKRRRFRDDQEAWEFTKKVNYQEWDK